MSTTRTPFREGFLDGDLTRLDSVRLAGSRCGECGIVLFGRRHRCENCSSRNLDNEVFAAGGEVFTFTIQRYPPPKPNAVPEPWSPRPLAWIDLDDNGPRVMGLVDCDPDAMRIGARVRLVCEVSWTDAEDREVVAYRFALEDAPR